MSKRGPLNTADAGGIWVPAPRGAEGRRIRGWRPGAPVVHPRWARGVGEGGEGPRGRGALTPGELEGCAQFSGKGRGRGRGPHLPRRRQPGRSVPPHPGAAAVLGLQVTREERGERGLNCVGGVLGEMGEHRGFKQARPGRVCAREGCSVHSAENGWES